MRLNIVCAGVTVLHTGVMQTVARHKTAMSRSMLLDRCSMRTTTASLKMASPDNGWLWPG